MVERKQVKENSPIDAHFIGCAGSCRVLKKDDLSAFLEQQRSL